MYAGVFKFGEWVLKQTPDWIDTVKRPQMKEGWTLLMFH